MLVLLVNNYAIITCVCLITMGLDEKLTLYRDKVLHVLITQPFLNYNLSL